MNKRAWLRSQGFVVGERGRLQPQAQAALDKAIAEGVDFTGGRGLPSTIHTRHGDVPVKKRRKRSTTTVKKEPQPEPNWVFAREIQTGPNLPYCCDTCLYSIGWCICGQTSR